MKILFILENTIKDLRGGTEVSSYHLASLLSSKGHQVEEWTPYKVRQAQYWYTGIILQAYILIVLLCELVKRKVDILHVQGKYLVPPAVLAGKLLRIPTVVTIRDYVVVCPIGLCLFPAPGRVQGRYLSHGFWQYLFQEIPLFLKKYHPNDPTLLKVLRIILLIRGWLVSKWLHWWLKRAAMVVAVSKTVKKILRNYGIKSTVIHNSFSKKDHPCGRKDDPLKEKTILFIGKPSYGKGYDLFRSLSRNKEFHKYRFKTIGRSKKLSYKKTLLAMKQALVVIVPSRWPEPFGRVALESLMMGTPVVATRRGGLLEIVEDGITGILAQAEPTSLAKALQEAIQRNKQLRRNINDHRSEIINKFQDLPSQKHLKLYNSLTANS